ncbi:hypothetical protein KN10_0317 [Anoxybacillus flavithermus NBRC 109594]|uniref:Uncharacterized protein n=1 Tax=Anoxybacillus flavithermus NBRC 109594 TaxID=1315967 RepID=R4F916_9BACL|nr:hypothetical protein KN10_0317 [Anoxybacillus flavithermus NBRC 109594]
MSLLFSVTKLINLFTILTDIENGVNGFFVLFWLEISPKFDI